MNNNANRPTCRAAVRIRPNGDRRGGARIHPRNCQIRYQIEPNGTMRKIKKSTGEVKPAKESRTVFENEFKLQLSYNGRGTDFVWDTGAFYTLIPGRLAKRMRILNPSGTVKAPLQRGDNIRVVVADGSEASMMTVRDVPLRITRTGEVVRGQVIIGEDTGFSLLGVNHIKNIKTLKVKFR